MAFDQIKLPKLATSKEIFMNKRLSFIDTWSGAYFLIVITATLFSIVLLSNYHHQWWYP